MSPDHPAEASGDSTSAPKRPESLKHVGKLHFEDSQISVYKTVVGPYDNNVFVLRCKESGAALLVDAANEHEQLTELCSDLGVRTVVETHGHWDHVQAVSAIREAGYEVAVAAEDAWMLPSYDLILEDDAIIEVGRVRVRTVRTPGHTPGSMCFLVEGSPVLFSGDTLFPGGPGNTSLPGGDFAQIIESIESRLFGKLEPRTIVMPGHGLDTTVGTEVPKLSEWIARGW